MNTATLEKIPNSIVEKLWKNIDFKTLKSYLQEENIENLEKTYYDKVHDNYWPFDWSLQAINFLTRKRWK